METRPFKTGWVLPLPPLLTAASARKARCTHSTKWAALPRPVFKKSVNTVTASLLQNCKCCRLFVTENGDENADLAANSPKKFLRQEKL